MHVVAYRYVVRPSRHAIVDALTWEVQSWFADIEPIPQELVAILQRMESKPTEGAARDSTQTTDQT